MKFLKKNITKLLNSDFRKKILTSVSPQKILDKSIIQYARYISDSQIVHRSKQFENQKDAYYGFNPIYPVCAVLNDGTFEKKFFEFNIVNHFLKEKDGIAAIEVIECILIEWMKQDKRIKDFDVKKIDEMLAELEKEFNEKEAKMKIQNEIKNQIKSFAETIVKKSMYENHDLACTNIKEGLDNKLKELVDSKKIFAFDVSFSDSPQSIDNNELNVNIGFKFEETAEFTVLQYHAMIEKADEKEEEIDLSSKGN